ncbi:MAG: PIG-L family deacetylase [Gemmatimonadaceae bacterium]
MKRLLAVAIVAFAVAMPAKFYAQQTGADWRRVLVIGAHPDDEDTQLIAWLQRSGRAETAYLSLTRGDGGQNLIGNELGEELGVIRTEELLAARRVDGAHQFFTRAYDFGFSKTAAETFAHWPKDSLLNDVVKVVRAFRPQVIVAVFSGTPRDGHGHHQVSGILGKEAFEMAMDTVRFPVSQFGPAWTASKFYRGARFSPDGATLKFNVGEYNPQLGKSYAEVAGESRSQHKSQGFGSLQRKGVIWDYLRRESSRVNEATDPKAEQSIFDGVTAPAPSMASGGASSLLSSVAVEAIADRQYVSLGDSSLVTVTLYNRARQPVEIRPRRGGGALDAPIEVLSDSTYRWQIAVPGKAITQPWWLATARRGDLFSPSIPVATPEMIRSGSFAATAEDQRGHDNDAVVLARAGNGQYTELRAPVVYRYADPVRGEVLRPLAVVPALSVSLDNDVELARANSQIDRFFNVTLQSAAAAIVPVKVSLTLPAGLAADSLSRSVTVDSAGTRTVTFRVRGKLSPGIHRLSATATSAGRSYQSGYLPIDYDHISPERIYRAASVNLHSVDVVVPARLRVGYVRGVGDNVEPSLEQLGIAVTPIDPKSIPTMDLSRFTTIVVGPRAYQASESLTDNNPYLLNFARNGGTLVVQYGQYEMVRAGMMPFPITIARPHDRVTEETAPVTIVDAASPVLKKPNAITNADFANWVQERSLYMPHTFDDHYRTVLSLNDPGEEANKGGIMIAPYGQGVYVYTTLAFFRQLPAAVPGATRLFVNLLSTTGAGSVARATAASGR